MYKQKLLYTSPLWPMKSGISEYSEILIMGLEQYYDITLLIDKYTLQNSTLKRRFPVIYYQKGKKYEEYDYILYNLGNNPDFHSYMIDMIDQNPGYVILHDYSLYYLAVDYYQAKGCFFQKLYEFHGTEGVILVKDCLKTSNEKDLLQHKELASILPLNKGFLKSAKGVFVHSLFTKKLLQQECNIMNVKEISFAQPILQLAEPTDKLFFREKFKNICNEDYVIGSVGFIAPSKQNSLICQMIREYNSAHNEKIHYVMIGEGNFVDDFIDDYIHKTGFLENDTFFKAIEECNLIFNLRYPYGGETSATLLQCMSMGLPCVVTDIGWFSELPDDSVIKVHYSVKLQELVSILENCISSDLTSLKENASRYIKEHCNPTYVAQGIFQTMMQLELQHNH